jgi:hypothetical protein
MIDLSLTQQATNPETSVTKAGPAFASLQQDAAASKSSPGFKLSRTSNLGNLWKSVCGDFAGSVGILLRQRKGLRHRPLGAQCGAMHVTTARRTRAIRKRQ